MTRLTKVHCLILWDSDPSVPGKGYVYVARNGDEITLFDTFGTVEYFEDHVKIRSGGATQMTAMISNYTWELLKDPHCPGVLHDIGIEV